MQKTIIIGIAGPSGSGKSLLATTIVNELGSKKVAVISEDSYYKDLGSMPISTKSGLNFDHPDSMDHELLIQQLQILKNGASVKIPQYDFSTHSRLNTTKTVADNNIIVLEGILLFSNPELRECMDIMIFVDTPLDICFIRRLERDVNERQRSIESVISQYQKTVRPMFIQFIEPSKRYADIIVPRGGKNRIAIDLLKTKIKHLLSNEEGSS